MPALPDGLILHRLADRPDLVDGVHALGPRVWPRFMMKGSAGEDLYAELDTTFVDCALVVVNPGGSVVCRALWVPLAWDGVLPLPDDGFDWVIEAGIADRRAGRPCTAASAIEIGIDPSLRGRGISGLLLAHMRSAAADGGAADLFAPVRPNGKHRFPREPMGDYLRRCGMTGCQTTAGCASTCVRVERSSDRANDRCTSRGRSRTGANGPAWTCRRRGRTRCHRRSPQS